MEFPTAVPSPVPSGVDVGGAGAVAGVGVAGMIGRSSLQVRQADEKMPTGHLIKILSGKSVIVKWMWNDGTSEYIQKHNPLRWSEVLSVEETMVKLEGYLRTRDVGRPVKLKVTGEEIKDQYGWVGTERVSNVKEALSYLQELVEAKKRIVEAEKREEAEAKQFEEADAEAKRQHKIKEQAEREEQEGQQRILEQQEEEERVRLAKEQVEREEQKRHQRFLEQEEEEEEEEWARLTKAQVDAFLKLHGYAGVNEEKTKVLCRALKIKYPPTRL